mmetsp:Transcript_1692/g.3433  ORF Transcript_1692/g.3433 Transcript_1692/m.3433 type:complete len:227 (-) Transcript_1692:90-770(-)
MTRLPAPTGVCSRLLLLAASTGALPLDFEYAPEGWRAAEHLRPALWQGGKRCIGTGTVEERSGEGLEALLAEGEYPFIAAFFSASLPLAQTKGLAETEQRVAAAFPSLVYIRVDADQLGIRAFLQWEVAFLPTYVLYLPPSEGQQRKWIRWKGEGGSNPYDYEAVASFIARATGLIPGNISAAPLAGSSLVQPRGQPEWGGLQLGVSWAIIAAVAVRRWFQRSQPA